MTVKIRTLSPSDYDAIITLWKDAGLTSLRNKGRDSRREITKQMRRDPDLFIGAFDGKRLVGTSVGSDDGRKGWINRLAVAHAYQRKGLAKMLLRKTEIALRRRGRKIICALIDDWNEASLGFFKNQKYVLHSDILYLSKRDSEEA